jgi:broad specificity phosphatase PhoE
MPIIYLLRHAQSVANTKGILAGQDNSVELSKDGHKQAQLLAPYLSTDQNKPGLLKSAYALHPNDYAIYAT